MFIAHTESRQRVKFIWEHVAANVTLGQVIKIQIKNRLLFFISLFHKSISKKQKSCKVKNAAKNYLLVFIDKIIYLSYIIVCNNKRL